MEVSLTEKDILSQINNEKTKLGDIRKLAKEIKKDHELAMELWSSNHFFARQLAILIMDKKNLTEAKISELINDIRGHCEDERLQLCDWLMANQLTKDKKLVAQIETWQNSSAALKRRIFWYYQGRLRWMGKLQPGSDELLLAIEQRIEQEDPDVQWAMNFTAGWIGVYEKNYRDRCVSLGESTGLFKGKKVSKGCTPEYLPEFITIESNKRDL